MSNEDRYHAWSRDDLIRYIDHQADAILDIGCGEGAFGANLKKRGLARRVVGIELVQAAAKKAESVLDRVICGDAETLDMKATAATLGTFDYIVCGDVLEHLRDPWAALRSLSPLLKDDGHLIASIPNVRYWQATLPLVLRGEWEYASYGILDRTHLRFFTRKTAARLFEQSGYRIVRCEGGLPNRIIDKAGILASLGCLREFFTLQWKFDVVRK